MSYEEPDQLFVVMWCNEGLECVIKADNPDHERTLAILKGSQPPQDIEKTVGMLMMRARFNTQRHYEIYSIMGAPGVDENMIRDMFEKGDPQYAADLIRSRGNKIYSDRAEPGRYKIL